MLAQIRQAFGEGAADLKDTEHTHGRTKRDQIDSNTQMSKHYKKPAADHIFPKRARIALNVKPTRHLSVQSVAFRCALPSPAGYKIS